MNLAFLLLFGIWVWICVFVMIAWFLKSTFDSLDEWDVETIEMDEIDRDNVT